MSSINDLAATLAGLLDFRLGGGPNIGASDDILRQLQERLDLKLPSDVREFYLIMNGTSVPTVGGAGAIRLWSLDEWVRAESIKPGRWASSQWARSVVFADHREESWWYCFQSSGDSLEGIFLLDGTLVARAVAVSFTDFIEQVIKGAPNLYLDG